MSDIKGKAHSLAQQELSRQNLLLARVGKLVGKFGKSRVNSLCFASEEQARLKQSGRWVGHDGVGYEESAQKDRSSSSDFGGQAAEGGGADKLDGEELEQLGLFGGREELGQRLILVTTSQLEQPSADVRLGEAVRRFSEFGQFGRGEGPQPVLG